MDNTKWFRTKTYEDKDGIRTIFEKTSIEESSDNGLIIVPIKFYKGVIPVRTKNGLMPFSFDFPNDFTLKECFDKFDEIAKNEIEKEKFKQSLTTPSKGLFVPKKA